MPMITSAAKLPTHSWLSGEVWLYGWSKEGGSGQPWACCWCTEKAAELPRSCSMSRGLQTGRTLDPWETCSIVWKRF